MVVTFLWYINFHFSISHKNVSNPPVNYFTDRSKAVLLLCIFCILFCLVFAMSLCASICLLCLRARLFICALWSPAGKGLTSWLSFVVSERADLLALVCGV